MTAEPECRPDPVPADEATLRNIEAVIFAASRPVPVYKLRPLAPPGVDIEEAIRELSRRRDGGPIVLSEIAGGWAFRTAPDTAAAVTRVIDAPRRIGKAGMEALAIVAWHQPITRSEIESIRGSSLSQQIVDTLVELGLVITQGHRDTPGRPSLWITTSAFLDRFGLLSLADLPPRADLVSDQGFMTPGSP